MLLGVLSKDSDAGLDDCEHWYANKTVHSPPELLRD
jgi:hypothetical protein